MRSSGFSVSSTGLQGNGPSIAAAITPDGRYVVFQSKASNFGPDTNGKADIFLKDRQTGSIERISVSSSGMQANGDSRFPQISSDGRYVVFQSEASNLVPGDTNGKWDIFLRDRQTGTTERISVSSSGSQSDRASARPSLSGDGRYVTFHSWATNLVPGDVNGMADVFLRDRQASSTTLVSVSSTGGQGNGDSQFPKISSGGSVVVFHSTATNLVANGNNGTRDTFARVLATSSTERISVSSSGLQANGPTGFASISSDGRYVVFHGTATNLVPGDTAGQQDVFVRDRQAGLTWRVSIGPAGAEANGLSGMASISPDGGFVAFHSMASNLVLGDTNSQNDTFVVAS